MGRRQIPAVAEQRKHPGWIVQLWVNTQKQKLLDCGRKLGRSKNTQVGCVNSKIERTSVLRPELEI